MEGLSMETVARDGNCQMFPPNFQQEFYSYSIIALKEKITYHVSVPSFLLYGSKLFITREIPNS